MQDTSFKPQDSVQLMNGYTYTMTISEINEETQKAFCVWLDPKQKKICQEWIPLNVLKHTPKPPSFSLEELIPKQRF